MGEILETDLAEFGEQFFQDPSAVYQALREHGPVLPVVLPNGWRGWLVTSYEDARRLLADHRLRKNVNEMARLFPPGSAAAYGSMLSRHMLNSDPPDHTRLRRLVSKAFTGRAVEQLRPRIERTAGELLAAMAATAAGTLAFGHGIHHCVGAPLARMEGQIAIRQLLSRFPDIALADADAPRWRRTLLMRGLQRLPVRIGAHGRPGRRPTAAGGSPPW